MTRHPARPWRDPHPDTTELAAQVGAAWEAIPDNVEADTLADAITQIVHTKNAAMAVIRDVWDAMPDDVADDVTTEQQVKLLVAQRDEARAQAAANSAASGDAAYWKRVADIALGALDAATRRGQS